MLNELQWIHNGDLSQPVRSTLSSALPLAIENVQLLHAGEYSCRAMLNNGSVVGPVSAGFLNVAGEYSTSFFFFMKDLAINCKDTQIATKLG